MNKDNLPYVFGVVFFVFVALSVRGVSLKRLKAQKICKILCLMKHFYRSLESSRVRALRNTVNVWDHMSRVTSPSIEQFGWSTCVKTKLSLTDWRPPLPPPPTSPPTQTSCKMLLFQLINTKPS